MTTTPGPMAFRRWTMYLRKVAGVMNSEGRDPGARRWSWTQVKLGLKLRTRNTTISRRGQPLIGGSTPAISSQPRSFTTML